MIDGQTNTLVKSTVLLMGSALLIGIGAAGFIGACGEPELEGAKAEVKPHNIKLDLPPVPDFKMPTPNSDGTHPVDEMRLRGKRYLGQSVQVKGFVISIYDCATAIRTPEMSEKEVKALIDEDPTRCIRPNFYIGSTDDAPLDKGIRVVENPRPPRADEKKLRSMREEVKKMQEAFKAVPAFKVGDEVIITGNWATRSPRGFRDSDGLLVFESLKNLSTPAKEDDKK